jgi:hypothetical protein
MARSEVAQLLQLIADEYRAAQWGLSGFASGTSRHQMITERTERMGKALDGLTELVGSSGTAMQLMAETLDALPTDLTRHALIELFGQELGHSEQTDILIERVQDLWETIDLLIECFGNELAHRIIKAPA